MDREGTIDQLEFITALAILGHGTLEERCQLVFNLYDFDKSKYISKDELTILMTNACSAMLSLAHMKDSSKQSLEEGVLIFFFSIVQEKIKDSNQELCVANIVREVRELARKGITQALLKGIEGVVTKINVSNKMTKGQMAEQHYMGDSKKTQKERERDIYTQLLENLAGPAMDKLKVIKEDSMDEPVTLSEFRKAALNKQAYLLEQITRKTKAFFDKQDIDGNERITFDEFLDFVRRDPAIIGVLTQFGVIQSDDAGLDLGNGEEKVFDYDLEEEVSCPDVFDEKRINTKFGIDFDTSDDQAEQKGESLRKPKKKMYENWKTVAAQMAPQKADLEHDLNAGCRPDASIDLEYIYGYRSHDVRNNLRYTSEGKIVYHAAAVGIVLDQRENTQSFMLDHDDDIISMAIDDLSCLCATGQVGAKPWICVWNMATMKCVARINNPLTVGIKHLAFSKDGNYLAATAMDGHNTVAVFSLERQDSKETSTVIDKVDISLHSTTRGPATDIWSLSFCPSDDLQICATCTNGVTIFQVNEAGYITHKELDMGAAPCITPCHAFVNDKTLMIGSHDGKVTKCIYSGKQWKCVKVLEKIHKDMIYCMVPRKIKNGFITGDKDGTIVTWRESGEDFVPEYTYIFGGRNSWGNQLTLIN